MSRQILSIGDTGSQLVSKFNLNRSELFNITSYGAVGDDNTLNTSSIQAAIDAAHAIGGGYVFVPFGTFKTGTLTFYDGVNLCGDGRYSILKSNAAEPLLNFIFPSMAWYHNIQDIFLEGNNIGTIGINTERLAFFSMRNIVISNFTSKGIYFYGSLLGNLYNICIDNCYIGVEALGITSPLSHCNRIAFNGCSFDSNIKYAVKWVLGSSITFSDCDFEGNGVNDDLTTGVIYYQNDDGLSNYYSPGLIIKNSWFEANYGTTIYLDESNVCFLNHIIDSSWLTYNKGTNVRTGIKIVGTTLKNKLILLNTNISTANNSIVMVGSHSIVVNEGSTYYNISNPDGGLVTTIYDGDGVKP